MKEAFKFALIFFVLIGIFLLVRFDCAHGYGIVNNSGSTPADSLSIPFCALDSVGNIVAMASGDSVFLYTFYPSGALATEDSAAYDGTKITAKTRHGFTVYSWKDAVSDIDGTAVQGVYSYMLIVKDLTSAALQTPHRGTFQLLTETDFNTTMEYVKDCLDTLQLHDDWVAHQTTVDSNYAINDSLLDTLLIVQDTLEAYDGWIAHQSTVDSNYAIGDSLLDTLLILQDTLEAQDDWIGNLRYEHSDSILELAGLHIRASGDDTAFIAQGSGVGSGGVFKSGTSATADGLVAWSVAAQGDGFLCRADTTGGSGIKVYADSGAGIYVYAHEDAIKLYGDFRVTGNYYDVNLAGDGTIHGIIDRATYVDSTDTIITEPNWGDSLYAILDTLQLWDDDIAVLIAVRDSVNAIIDSLQNQDDWVASEANVTEVLDTLKTYDEAGRFQLDIQEVLDTLQVYDNANQLRPEVAAVLDTLQNQDDWIATSANQTFVIDTVNGIMDTLQNQDNWVATSANQTLVIDTVNATLDTIQAHAPHGNDWGQGGGNLTAITDTVNAILDTLQLWDDNIALLIAMRDSINATLDTLQVWDDDIALLVAMRDSINATLDTIQAGFGSRSAIGDTIQREASTFDPTSDNVAVVDSVTGVARVDSVRKVYLVDSLDQIITATCAGSGVRTIIFMTLDASDSSVVTDVRIEAQTGGSYYADCHTNIAGLCTLSLDDATYTIHINDPPNDFTSPITFKVTADSTDTLFGTIFAGSAPPSADKCNLYASIYDLTGDSLNGCVLSVWAPSRYYPITVSGVVISPYTVTATSDVHGDVDINIWESNQMTAGDTTLTVKVNIEIRKPDGSLIDRAMNYTVPDSVNHKIVW